MTTYSPVYLVVNYLLGFSSLVLDLFSDTDMAFGRMVFRDGIPQQLRLSGTGKRVVVLSNAPGTVPFGSHFYSSNVQARFYADHTRDVNGNATVENGLDRAWDMFGKFDQALWRGDAESLLFAGADADPAMQINRSSPPFESYDQDQDVPYVTVSYDVAVLASV